MRHPLFLSSLGSLGPALALLLSTATARAFQSVHVVAPTGSGAVQAAVDAASEGDLVLVQPGSYGPVTVAAKSLVVVADSAGTVTLESLTVRDLGVLQSCQVLGVRTTGFALPERAALRVLFCAGSVRIESVRSEPAFATAAHAAVVANSADVVFADCTLTGGPQQPPLNLNPDPAGKGLSIVASRVSVFDSTVMGANGRNAIIAFGAFFVAGTGAAAVSISGPGAELFASGATIRGGNGGWGSNAICIGGVPNGSSPGLAGGNGVVTGPGASTTLRDCTVLAGPGGVGGACAHCPPLPPPPPGCGAADGADGVPISGGASVLAQARVRLSAPTHAREGQTLAITVTGPPGAEAILALSTGTRWLFYAPFAGTLHFADASRRFALGPIPGSGVLTTSLPIGALPDGTEFTLRHMQALARDPSGSVSAGSPAVVALLDQSF